MSLAQCSSYKERSFDICPLLDLCPLPSDEGMQPLFVDHSEPGGGQQLGGTNPVITSNWGALLLLSVVLLMLGNFHPGHQSNTCHIIFLGQIHSFCLLIQPQNSSHSLYETWPVGSLQIKSYPLHCVSQQIHSLILFLISCSQQNDHSPQSLKYACRYPVIRSGHHSAPICSPLSPLCSLPIFGVWLISCNWPACLNSS